MGIPEYWIPRPAFQFDSSVVQQLKDVFARVIAPGKNLWLEESLPVPIWEFLCWLTDEKNLLLHGSHNPNIQEFEPRTPDAEDDDAFSQQTAVFASSDGIWPMFYAILDRSFKLRMLNSVLRFEIGPDELSIAHYFFSITDSVLEQRPWREGVMYVLPRDGFSLQPPYTVTGWRVHDPHWASLQPVRPLARIRVQPQDFPLLAQVLGHDEATVVARVARDPEGFPWL